MFDGTFSYHIIKLFIIKIINIILLFIIATPKAVNASRRGRKPFLKKKPINIFGISISNN